MSTISFLLEGCALHYICWYLIQPRFNWLEQWVIHCFPCSIIPPSNRWHCWDFFPWSSDFTVLNFIPLYNTSRLRCNCHPKALQVLIEFHNTPHEIDKFCVRDAKSWILCRRPRTESYQAQLGLLIGWELFACSLCGNQDLRPFSRMQL